MTVYAATFTTVSNNVISKARLDATDDASMVADFINLTIARVAVRSKFFKGSSSGPALSAGATSQTLPTAIVELDGVTVVFGGQSLIVSEVDYGIILRYRQSGNTSGPPTIYALRQGTVEFWPNAAGGEVATYAGAILPDTISGTTAIPLPEPFSKLVEYGALAQVGEFKKDPLLGSWQASYDRFMAEFMAFVNRRGGVGRTTFPVQGPGGAWIPSNPSTDVPWYS